MNKKIIIKNIDDLNTFSIDLLKNLKDKINIITLTGDLGTGKTTLVQQIAKNLNIKEIPNSPTFTISKTYKIPENKKFENLIHLDLYRLKNEQELDFIGLTEQLKNPKNLIFIEWPELAKNILSKNLINISIKHLENNEREIFIK